MQYLGMPEKNDEDKISNQKILKELQTVRKLLVLQLLNSGIQGSSIEDLIEMDQGDFSRMFPVRKLLKM